MELISQIITIAVSVITALGGSKLLESWSNRRKTKAEAEAAEIKNEQTEVERLEFRLNIRDQKIDTLYFELRATQDQNLSLIAENSALKVLKCNNITCENRKPPFSLD